MNKKAVAYFRTSSTSGIGENKDTLPRQKVAVETFAKSEGIKVIKEFYDAGISGDTLLEQRPAVAQMLGFMEQENIHIILVENAERWSRSVMVQELAVLSMQRVGVAVITASGQDLTSITDATNVALRQIQSVFAQMEKGKLVQKLRDARKRKKEKTGRCEGKLGFARHQPELVQLAKKLRRRNPRSHKHLSYDKISQELFNQGFTTANGRLFNSNQIRRLCGLDKR